MMTNQELHTSLLVYMTNLGWEPKSNNGSMVSWCKHGQQQKILLPTDEFINDEHASFLYDKAVKLLSANDNMALEDLKTVLQSFISNADTINVRTSGVAIKHGKINLFSGSKALSAISSLIKSCAQTHVKTKRGLKKRLEEHYLNCVNLVVPQEGSFIHRVEIELAPLPIDSTKLSETNNEIPNEPINRSINVRLAKLLLELRDIEQDKISLTNLVRLGVTERVTSTLIDVFSDEVDLVEYKFNWSPSFEAPKLATNTIAFDRSHREKFVQMKSAFSDAKSFNIEDVAAHIDGFLIPEDGDELSLLLKLELEGRVRSCQASAKRDKVEKVMAQISNDSKQFVTVSGRVTKIVNGTQTSYSLTEATITGPGAKQLLLL
ncbi:MULTISPECIES: hypothetical protein [Vibrio]|uniref:hypothetical protein n=1 Tax=Vibrio TaxID=662 RepID=UPI001EEC2B05|nr:hypothetical protein [Vibrio fluvialis]MCG6229746.1 hypothetical protein [Vibrio furnissii]MCG6372818.1 hypothetical protein [Vibrio fluvialis]